MKRENKKRLGLHYKLSPDAETTVLVSRQDLEDLLVGLMLFRTIHGETPPIGQRMLHERCGHLIEEICSIYADAFGDSKK
jgi:hypothetical protein